MAVRTSVVYTIQQMIQDIEVAARSGMATTDDRRNRASGVTPRDIDGRSIE